MWEIIARRVPYEDQRFKNIQDVKDAICSGARPTLDHFDNRQHYVDLMRQCWSSNLDERPPFSEIVARVQLMRREDSERNQSDEHVELDESSV